MLTSWVALNAFKTIFESSLSLMEPGIAWNDVWSLCMHVLAHLSKESELRESVYVCKNINK